MNDVDATWFFRPTPRPQAAVRLFCFPYAGAGAAAFRGWDRALPPDLEVVAVRFPGRESRFLEEPFETLEPLVDAVVEALRGRDDRPFALFGHSLGALVAYETTRRLVAAGARLPVHLFASARVAPHLQDPDGRVHTMSDDELVGELRARGQTPDEVLDNAELLELLLPAVRADFAIAERYRHRPGPPLPVAITALGGTADPDVPVAAVEAWRVHTEARFTSAIYPGGHFFLDVHLDAIAGRIGAALAPHLRGAA